MTLWSNTISYAIEIKSLSFGMRETQAQSPVLPFPISDPGLTYVTSLSLGFLI